MKNDGCAEDCIGDKEKEKIIKENMEKALMELDLIRKEEIKKKRRITEGKIRLGNKFSLVKRISAKFKLVKTFEITVPAHYNSENYLLIFRRSYAGKFNYFDGNINDWRFKLSAKISPGQKMKVKIFEYVKNTNSRDSLVFLRDQKALFVGAQGIALIYEVAKKELFEGLFISFDKKEALWKDKANETRVPALKLFLNDKFAFLLDYFNKKARKGSYLLCFCDESL